jgi:pantoate--beta-alanine ligase
VDVIESRDEFRARCDAVRSSGEGIGFVPTMGFFHEGHLSLMRAARAASDHVVLSIFVNPLQFGPSEDFATYPRDPERDLAMAKEEGVDVAFVPEVEEMYPDGPPSVTVDPGPLGDVLEGAARPGHFRGVCTVVARLFHLVGPSRAFFGQKDAQQLAIVRGMVRDLAFPIEVVGCPIVREPDRLAMSSRNTYLSASERRAALCVPAALRAAEDAVRDGVRHADEILVAMRKTIEAEPAAEVGYVALVDEESFEPVSRIEGRARALVAARIGRPRLIDNTLLVVGQN